MPYHAPYHTYTTPLTTPCLSAARPTLSPPPFTTFHLYNPHQARTALLEADAARGREQQQQALVAQLQQRASQAAAAAAKAARSKVGGAELAALQQAQAMAESVAGELALAPLPYP